MKALINKKKFLLNKFFFKKYTFLTALSLSKKNTRRQNMNEIIIRYDHACNWEHQKDLFTTQNEFFKDQKEIIQEQKVMIDDLREKFRKDGIIGDLLPRLDDLYEKILKYEEKEQKWNEEEMQDDELYPKHFFSPSKKCTQCKVTREMSLFVNDKDLECKTCDQCRSRSQKSNHKRKREQRELNKELRQKNPEKVKLYNKSYKKKENWEEVKKANNIEDDKSGSISNKRKEHTTIETVVGKECSKCNTWKPLDDYNKYSSHWDGLKQQCKPCLQEYRKQNKQKL